MQDIHEPSPEFTRYLEWQTRTELRRQDRFTRPAAIPRLARFTRIAALVVTSLFCGAGVVVAAERIQDSRALEILLERNRLLIELSERRVAASSDVLEREQLLYEQGMATQTGFMNTQARTLEFERDRDRLHLDRAEMEAARRGVDDRVSARLVGTRDFVTEHLRVDRTWLVNDLELRELREAVARAQYEAGVRVLADLVEASHATLATREDIARVDTRLALRADFVLGRIDARECESRDLVDDAESRHAGFAREATRIESLLERARAFEAAGLGSGDVSRLQAERDAVQVELQLIDLELELLR